MYHCCLLAPTPPELWRLHSLVIKDANLRYHSQSNNAPFKRFKPPKTSVKLILHGLLVTIEPNPRAKRHSTWVFTMLEIEMSPEGLRSIENVQLA